MITNISCPACQRGVIKVEAHLLASGKEFGCTSCDASISVAKHSQNTLQKGIEDYDKLQDEIVAAK